MEELNGLISQIRREGIRLETGHPLAEFTTFKIGGPAAALAFPADTGETAILVKSAYESGVPFVTLGWGSNILIADEGFPGLVISTRDLNYVEFDGTVIRAGAGVSLPDLAADAGGRGLAGMEEICDVPGTLGGGVYMNAGCNGVFIGDILVDVTWVEHNGTVVAKPRDEIYLGYRESEFTGTRRIVTEVTIKLSHSKLKDEIIEKMNGVKTERASKFPLDFPNCGSVFKRVPREVAAPWVEKDGKGAYSAGYYIERCDLKTRRIGNAMISDVHANFFVNLGGATARDVKELIRLAQAEVYSKYRIELVREVVFLDADGLH